MQSIVLELQHDLLAGECDIMNALRKAHIIASKLKLKEFDEWICNELNGYNCSTLELPAYRRIRGNVEGFNRYRGWIPCVIPNTRMEDVLSTIPLFEPLSTIIELARKAENTIQYRYSGDVFSKLQKFINSSNEVDLQISVSASMVKAIPELVKNCLIEWTLRLEEHGIKGEDMMFNEKEHEAAKRVPQQINNYYGTVINGQISQSQISSGDNNTFNYYDDIKKAIPEIEESIRNEIVNDEDREAALELLQDISQKLSAPKKRVLLR